MGAIELDVDNARASLGAIGTMVSGGTMDWATTTLWGAGTGC